MSSFEKIVSTGVQVTATQNAPALDETSEVTPERRPVMTSEVTPEHPCSFASAAAPSPAQADGGGSKLAKRKPREMTPAEQTAFEAREKNRAWLKDKTDSGMVIGVVNFYATKKQREAALANGTKPKPSTKDLTRKMKSIKDAMPGCSVRITSREDTKQFYKVVYVAIPNMSREDITRFSVTPYEVTEQKQFPAQTWTSTFRITIHDVSKPVQRATARFAAAPDPLVDVIRYEYGLPDMPEGMEDDSEEQKAWLMKQKVPRCFNRRRPDRPGGGLWNPVPGNPVPGNKVEWCQKSGKHRDGYRGQSARNLAVFAALRDGTKVPHLFCKFAKTDMWAAGVSNRADYKLVQGWWMRDSVAMREHYDGLEAKAAAKVARDERRAEAAAPDADGFATVVAGGRKKVARKGKSVDEDKPAIGRKSAFAGLPIEGGSESESEVSESEDETPPQPIAPPAEPIRLSKAERQARNRAKKGVRFEPGLVAL